MRPETKLNSIADIARVAGVSVSTVSRALAGKGTLNAGTRDRIRKLAETHGFRPNVAAQNLRLGRTGAIAVMLPLGHEKGQHLSDPFFMAMLGILADNLSERGHDLLLCRVIPSDSNWLGDFALSGRVDGIIVIGQSDQGAVLSAVGTNYDSMVVWGAHQPDQTYVTVGTDNFAGGRLAAEHLIARGCRRLAFFGNPDSLEFGARYKGFLSALSPDLRAAHVVLPVQLTANESHAAASDFLRANNPPDGVFATSDVVAMSVIRAATENGITVPEGLAVVGFDDVPLAAQAIPPLTTIRQNLEEGGRLLCELLFRRMAGEDCAPVQLPPTLVIRESA